MKPVEGSKMTWEELCEKPVPKIVFWFRGEKMYRSRPNNPLRVWRRPCNWREVGCRIFVIDSEVFVVWKQDEKIKRYPDIETAKVAVLLQGE